ncbi:helix-turn-helix transcriptional regulator [bacterium]|nr:helix-turn-helix transcriptional regulator [Alphaproteobacteria bacterium]MBR1424072.1 helix-turn-helix transcriptional regulator [bacterium]
MNNIKERLGKRIKELRKRQNLTQEKLSEIAGIEIPSLSNIENGKNYPNHETLAKISDALRVKPYELFMFDYYVSKEQMINEIIKKMENDDELARKLYQFFLCVK